MVNDVARGGRAYRGGASEFTALMTVVREVPSRSEIRAFGTPTAGSLLISAQSSKVITLQSLSAHLSPAESVRFSSADDSTAGQDTLHPCKLAGRCRKASVRISHNSLTVRTARPYERQALGARADLFGR